VAVEEGRFSQNSQNLGEGKCLPEGFLTQSFSEHFSASEFFQTATPDGKSYAFAEHPFEGILAALQCGLGSARHLGTG
jgi:hypothetical protein